MNQQSFSRIRRQISGIHVFNDFEGVTIVTRKPLDAEYEMRRYADHFIEGCGSRKDPYRYRGAAPVSPHFAIIDLWFEFHIHTGVFIQANDWMLKVERDGVRAADGCLTRLVSTNAMIPLTSCFKEGCSIEVQYIVQMHDLDGNTITLRLSCSDHFTTEEIKVIFNEGYQGKAEIHSIQIQRI